MGRVLDDLFARCEAAGASDIHLSTGLPPYFRCKGNLSPDRTFQALAREQVVEIAGDLLFRMSGRGAGSLDALLKRSGSLDGACTSATGGRYRFNIFQCQAMGAGCQAAEERDLLSLGISIRLLESRFRSLAELGLPARLETFCGLKDGLVIVSGPTGSGKSTTLATLLDEINRTRPGHIITIEDPVEYIHLSARSLVHQRQIGIDAPDFNSALVDALREDPDIVLVGEIRELETIRTAITAAETGHLVFTTLHAGDCVGAIERLVSVFPSGEQEAIRRQLSLVLRGIVAQRLLPSEKKGTEARRLPVCEILVNTPAVANLVASGKPAQIYSAMETGTMWGMQTLEQDLARLYLAGEISQQTAAALARNPSVFLNRIRNGRQEGPR